MPVMKDARHEFCEHANHAMAIPNRFRTAAHLGFGKVEHFAPQFLKVATHFADVARCDSRLLLCPSAGVVIARSGTANAPSDGHHPTGPLYRRAPDGSNALRDFERTERDAQD